MFRGNRVLWTIAGVAVLSLAAGLVLGRFVVSPADAAEEVPAPGLVTVPVEYGALSNDVTVRGDVGYVDATELTLDTSSFDGPAVVTGQVPEAGAELKPLSIALEVAGRPVLVLPGELPAYRTLRIGVAGPDVIQLKEALAAVGIEPGDRGSNVFDQATADAVGRLYTDAGYPAPPAPEGANEALRSAEDGVRAADSAVADAEKTLAQAGSGVSEVEVKELDNAVAAAQRELDAAKAAKPRDGLRIGAAGDALALAQLQRKALDAPRDTSAEQAALTSAQEQRTAAQEQLESARIEVQPYLPASEVLYLAELPRRVDAINVKRGDTLGGAAMTVSGATVSVKGSIAETDADLIEPDAAAVFDLPDGSQHPAKVTSVEKGEDGGRWSVTLEPEPLTPEQIAEVQGTNVRITIPVGSTEGEVLSVPYAALTAGPGGESRVEVVTGDPRDGEDAQTRLVTVETGLAADGYVEVKPTSDELAEGDLVVVGS
ncbi:hypothetical protein K5S26_15200 [Microbacterium marinilacus]|nr:hypothetical protein [Microbacterium marinilacus]